MTISFMQPRFLTVMPVAVRVGSDMCWSHIRVHLRSDDAVHHCLAAILLEQLGSCEPSAGSNLAMPRFGTDLHDKV